MSRKIIAFDLDDVLCSRPDGSEQLGVDKYLLCKPNEKMINILNDCYNKGHHIVVYTARGMTQFSGCVPDIYSNLYDLTFGQLNLWGAKYHQLVMGKLHYDLLIDDKAVFSDEIHNLEDIESRLNNGS